ncbi:bacterioferritin [Oryzomicrobium terrae]|uniref:Bacterioferritin n=1 Tax=Oryzomicrobium terrae TaxID=1735038 RepID=A0A5C1E6L6_9RHOO|nr:bacterioferritin [Oryzomicrobium terrae]QEL64315.1 bacterioferritin [Oryzomicrobium terrae]
MKGDKKIITQLNSLLAGELTAIDQYFIHAEMYKDWGLNALFERINHEMEDEREHARQLIARILFLEGTPDLSKREPLNIGKDTPSMLENDLALEYSVVKHLKEVIAECEKAQDYVTRELLVTMLDDTEEDHAHWLEKQLRLIKLTGLQNYLQSQMSGAA